MKAGRRDRRPRRRSAQNPAIQHALEEVKGRGVPEWLSFDAGTMTGRIASLPTREQINLPVQEQLIVELYSQVSQSGTGSEGPASVARSWQLRRLEHRSSPPAAFPDLRWEAGS